MVMFNKKNDNFLITVYITLKINEIQVFRQSMLYYNIVNADFFTKLQIIQI